MSGGERRLIVTTQAGTFSDTIALLQKTITGTDIYGVETTTWSIVNTIPCQFVVLSAREVQSFSTEIGIVDSKLYFPLDTVVIPTERMQVIALYGQALPQPINLMIVSPVLPGLAAQSCLARTLTGG